MIHVLSTTDEFSKRCAGSVNVQKSWRASVSLADQVGQASRAGHFAPAPPLHKFTVDEANEVRPTIGRK